MAIVSKTIVSMFDTTNGRELGPPTPAANVGVAAVSPDGHWVAIGTNDATQRPTDYRVRAFDSATGKEILTVRHLGPIRSLAFSADARWLAAGSDEGTARVFDMTTGSEAARLTHRKPVTSVAFSDDARWVATGSEDGAARVFDVSNGVEVSRRIHQCDGGAQCAVLAVAFSHDGRWVVSGGDDKAARVFEAAGANDVTRLAELYPVTSMVFAADGQRLISGSGSIDAALVRVFDAPTWREVLAIKPTLPEVRAMAASANGRTIAIASNWGGGPWVYNVDHPEEVLRQGGGPSLMESVALSGEGGWAASVASGHADVFEVATGKNVPLPGTAVHAIALSVDSRSLAVGAGTLAGGTVDVFKLPGATKSWQFAQHEPVLSVSLSADGRWLAAASGPQGATIRLVDATTGRERWSRLKDSGTLVSFAPEGTTVAIASGEGALLVFETASGKEISRIFPSRAVGAIGFAERGRYLMAASVAASIYSTPDVIVTRYPLRQSDLIRDACSRVTRNLSDEEWKQRVSTELSLSKTCSER